MSCLAVTTINFLLFFSNRNKTISNREHWMMEYYNRRYGEELPYFYLEKEMREKIGSWKKKKQKNMKHVKLFSRDHLF